MAILLASRTTNGSGTAVTWYGGPGTFYAQGTFNGASVQLEASFDEGTTWIPLDGGAATSATALNFNLGITKLRATLSNAGAGTSITAGV